MLFLGIKQIGMLSTIKNSHKVQKINFFARLVIDFKHSRYPDSIFKDHSQYLKNVHIATNLHYE
jgi:hypothetical protein